MTEEEARRAVEAIRPVSHETWETLRTYVALLLQANQEQNLIGRSTEAEVWGRHIWDSAQLLRFAPAAQRWVDVGSGAGLPGLVIAILTGCEMHLIEPRRLRAEFLQSAVECLGLRRVTVHRARAAAVRLPPAEVITARAVASATELIEQAQQLASKDTLWVLPKGRGAATELDIVRALGFHRFDLHPSLADPQAAILVGTTARRPANRARR